MLRNFFYASLRNLRKNKTYSFLNIFGLAIGITCAGLIFLWVEDELHFDGNNLNQSQLYMVRVNFKIDAGTFTHGSTPGPLGPALKATVPGLAGICRMSEGLSSSLFNVGDRPLYASGLYAEPSVFDLFTLPFVQGNAKNAFAQLYSLVITEKTAKGFFGTTGNVIGKTVRVDGKQDYVVTGVVKDLPANTTLQFEWLAPFQVYEQQNPWISKWNNFGLSTFVQLKPGTSLASVNQRLYQYLQKEMGDIQSTNHFFLFPMKDWHLYDQFENGVQTGGGRIQYVHLFSIIAWIILFIACINFMNLSTARSEKRAREVGVRKVLGAGKRGLVTQFLAEALFMSLLATLAAVFLMALLLPAFNTLVQKDLALGLDQPAYVGALLTITLICGLVAGSYPSLYLSSFNPVFVLKGIKIKAGSASFIRKGLVILQFTISIVLITATIIIFKQVNHIKSRNLGFKKDHLLQMDATGEMGGHFSAIRQDLINTGAVENVALGDHATITGGNNTSELTWPGKNPESIIVVSQRLVSPEFIATAGMRLTAGRDFQSTDILALTKDLKPLDSTATLTAIVTQTMEKTMGKGSAVGKTLELPRNDGPTFHIRIVGVVQDYVYGDMYGKPMPLVLYCIPQATNLLFIRIKTGIHPEQALSKMEAVMKKDNPGYPFEYQFVDDQFNRMFLSEMLISKLSGVFAALAILISCLGLFGLAAYTAEQRVKEIGIRKVLGASAAGLAGLLSKDFLQLVGISCIIAFPIAWYAMHAWLQNYQYRISIPWWLFLLSGAAAILIALVTVSFQAVKAAIANPVTSLRAE